MIAAYSNGERTIGRQIIEEVAENLDMLPRIETLLAADAKLDTPESHVLRPSAAEELWTGQERTAEVKPRLFSEEPDLPGFNANGNGKRNGHHSVITQNGHSDDDGYINGKANGNGHKPHVYDNDDDVLEIGSTFYKL
jgi:hypothetical protein